MNLRAERTAAITKRSPWRAAQRVSAAAIWLLAAALVLPLARADEPYAPTREYDLQNARIELRFDVDQKKISGQVTHTLAALREGLRQLDFDSVELTISSVRVNGKDAHFSTDSKQLHVDLDHPSKLGEKYEVAIRYEGQPKKGVYFVLPNKDYPNQPKEIWTQGESEDTRYYIPIYDYPNDRLTWEMIATVPANWVTVSNGKLESVTDAGQGLKTWSWREPEPASTYLISLVAGEFVSSKQTWRNIPVEYYVPKGDSDRIEPTFAHTRDMLSFFSDRVGVPYPWVKYSQTMVDQFVEGGMENVSATTLTTRGLLDPTLAAESLERSDNLVSHEMGHQWFGDLVTTKDWANLWLNEGFATFMAQLWEEHQYGTDNMAYSRWRAQAGWMRQARLFGVPIVTRDFNDSMEYAGNIYNKGGMVLEMLREKMGDDAFFHGLQHYLETNRLQNVVTADLVRALEESSHQDLDRFFDEWVYGGGAPRFAVTSTYDAATKQVKLQVKQTQNVAGHVGLFEAPIDVEVATSSGTKTFPITVSKADEQFSFPADSEPLMVLFDKDSKILKAVDFHKSPTEWIYQLQHADDVPDRAEAAQSLGDVKGNDAVVAALGEAALHDAFWGVRVQAITALGKIGGAAAEPALLAALSTPEPWVRDVVVDQLSKFKDDATLGPRLSDISRDDKAYRVRAAALTALGQLKASGAREALEAAVRTESPDDTLRRAALRALGALGDDEAVPLLRDWSAEGKPVRVRTAAIASLGELDKKNADIESELIADLNDTDFDIRLAAVFALGQRGDPAAIAPLEALKNSPMTPSGTGPMIEQQINRLKNPGRDGERGANQPSAAAAAAANAGVVDRQVADRQIMERLDRLETALTAVTDQLKKIEQQMSGKAASQ